MDVSRGSDSHGCRRDYVGSKLGLGLGFIAYRLGHIHGRHQLSDVVLTRSAMGLGLGKAQRLAMDASDATARRAMHWVLRATQGTISAHWQARW